VATDTLTDEQAIASATQQLRRPVNIQKVHISEVRPWDTVLHDGLVATVCASNLRRCGFMGRLLFGDSYVLGRKPVLRILMPASAEANQTRAAHPLAVQS
jgi:hypothetical protein